MVHEASSYTRVVQNNMALMAEMGGVFLILGWTMKCIHDLFFAFSIRKKPFFFYTYVNGETKVRTKVFYNQPKKIKQEPVETDWMSKWLLHSSTDWNNFDFTTSNKSQQNKLILTMNRPILLITVLAWKKLNAPSLKLILRQVQARTDCN